MTNLNIQTNSYLTARYNELTGKSVKVGSYPKAKMILELDKIFDQMDREVMTIYGRGFDEETACCPHCGANHFENGYQVAEGLEGDHDLTHEFICLACNGEWGPKVKRITTDFTGTGETFTLAELARSMGVAPKAARARYRAVENDKVRTRYIFEKTKAEIARVANIIKGKGA